MKPCILKKLRAHLVAVMLMAGVIGAAAQSTVTGNVTDTSGEPLIGVSIQVKGVAGGTVTDIDGNYSIKVATPKTAVLLFTYIGMDALEEPVRDRTVINVVMKENSKVLEELVVVGYGTMKKSDLTGSVSRIDDKAMKQTIATNVDQMLQGKVAGVQVTQNSGAPGGATSIRIRGASSLNSSNEPLYVIDGVPMNTSGSEIGGFSWAGGTDGQNKVNPLASIAPSDIVSMDILKDASACAIYGAAGANGVVLITTRRGKSGTAALTYDGYVAWQQVAKRLDMMNLREYATYQQQLYAEGVLTDKLMDESFLDTSMLGRGTDWQDEIFRTAFMQNHQLSLTGGNDKTQYAMSGGWMKQEGIIIGSDFTRFNSRFNLDHKLTDWLQLGGTLAYTRTDEKITLNDGSDGVIMQAMTMMPSVPVRDFDGKWAGPNTVNGSSQWNPVALALEKNNTLLRQKVNGNFYLSLDFLKWFNFRSEYAYDASQNQNKAYVPRYKFGQVSNDINQMMQREDHSFFWMQKDYITFHKTFAQKHDVTAMGGFEASKSSWNGTMLIKKNFTTDDIFVLGSDGEFVKNTGWKDAATSASFYGRFNYGFDSRYLVTATIRRDGSSKFGSNRKWGNFPSFALAWRANQESFLKDYQWLNNLKLRAGYGRVGNSNIDTYLYAAAMMEILTANGTAYIPKNLSNPNLQWESSEQWNIGLDFAAFNNRVEFTLEFYKKSTKDLLMQVFTPDHFASNDWETIQTPFANIGKTENKGVDFQIIGRPIVTKDFNWNSTLTLSHNKNKIVALNDKSQRLYGKIDWFAPFGTATMFAVGQPMGVFYGYQTEGLFKNEAEIVGHATQTGGTAPYSNRIDKTSGAWVGDLKFVDRNGDGIIDAKDQTVIGDPNPDVTFGWTNNFQYKNWELSVGLTGQIGGDVLNWARYMTEGVSSIWDNQAASVLDRAITGWKDPKGGEGIDNAIIISGGENGIPRFSSLDGNGNRRMSDRWIEDGSYLRIQNIALSYNLPQKWAKAAYLQSAHLLQRAERAHLLEVQRLRPGNRRVQPERPASEHRPRPLSYPAHIHPRVQPLFLTINH